MCYNSASFTRCVAVWCRMLQYVVVCLQCALSSLYTATHCNTLQHTCNTLQQTATHCITTGDIIGRWSDKHTARHCKIKARCSTLQHAATHCNTLQHTARHCNTICDVIKRWSDKLVLHCNALQHIATRCNTLQHTAKRCNTLQRTATHSNTLQQRQYHRRYYREMD